MFFIYFANGPGESSLLSSLGPAASFSTLLCVIIVTVAMVLLTLMCVCSKKTASVKLQNNNAHVPENRVMLKQLSKTEDIESQLTDANKEETNDDKLPESVHEESCVPATSTTHLKEETRPASHPSPCLPPRNLHNSHTSAHQSSNSVQASSRASTPASLERIHDDCHSNKTTAASSTTATEGAMASSQLPNHSGVTCRVQPDYEEVDLPEKPPSANTKVDECDDSNIYQDIDLNQETKSQKTVTASNSDSIEPYAEFKEDSKKSSDVLKPLQGKSTSLQTSKLEAPTGIKLTTEIPEYAKVDKSRKSHHDASSNSSLADHLPEGGVLSREVTSGSGGSRSSAPPTNVTELYTQVHKPKGNVVVSNENDKGLHVSKSHESVNVENSKVADGDMVLNPCYGTTMLQNYPAGATSSRDSTQASEGPTLEEPPYSTINDDRAVVTVNPDPGYSSIYEVRGAYAEIATTSQGAGGSGAAGNATGGSSSNGQPKEPIYDLVDATARDDVTSSQRM